MRKTSNVVIAVSIIPDLILGNGFDLENGYNIEKVKKRIVDAVKFEIGLTYGDFSDKETLNLTEVIVIRLNDDNPKQIDLSIKSSFNHLIISMSEFNDALEMFYMGVVAYFDKLGFDIVSSAAVTYVWDQGYSLDISSLSKYDTYLQSEDCQKQIMYLDFRDRVSFTIDEMDGMGKAWDELISEITEDEDDILNPRSIDDILRDLLGGEDED